MISSRKLPDLYGELNVIYQTLPTYSHASILALIFTLPVLAHYMISTAVDSISAQSGCGAIPGSSGAVT